MNLTGLDSSCLFRSLVTQTISRTSFFSFNAKTISGYSLVCEMHSELKVES